CDDDSQMIDDMEADTANGDADDPHPVVRHNGIEAPWRWFYNSPDGTKSLVAATIPGGRCASKRAIHAKASNFSGYGAGILLDLNPCAGGCAISDPAHDESGPSRCPFDASLFDGVQFWARSDNSINVRFVVNDVNIDPCGGICDPDRNSSNACFVS